MSRFCSFTASTPALLRAREQLLRLLHAALVVVADLRDDVGGRCRRRSASVDVELAHGAIVPLVPTGLAGSADILRRPWARPFSSPASTRSRRPVRRTRHRSDRAHGRLHPRRHRGNIPRGAPARSRSRRVRPGRRRHLVRRGRRGLARVVCLRRLREGVVPGDARGRRPRDGRRGGDRPTGVAVTRADCGRAGPAPRSRGCRPGRTGTRRGRIPPGARALHTTDRVRRPHLPPHARGALDPAGLGRPDSRGDGHADQRPPAERGARAGNDGTAVAIAAVGGPRPDGRAGRVGARRLRNRVTHRIRQALRGVRRARLRDAPRRRDAGAYGAQRRRCGSARRDDGLLRPRPVARRSGTGMRRAQLSSSEPRSPPSSRPP